MEEWRPVVGYDGYYEVSNLGRVKRVRSGKGSTVGSILKYKDNGHGYKTVDLSANNMVKRRYVHRLVTESFIGPRPSSIDVNHKDGIKSNNRLENLEYMTRSQNQIHSYAVLGTKPPRCKGEDHGHALLTGDAVRAIRKELVKYNTTMTRVLAKRYGVSGNTVRNVAARRSWKHIK